MDNQPQRQTDRPRQAGRQAGRQKELGRRTILKWTKNGFMDGNGARDVREGEMQGKEGYCAASQHAADVR